MRRKLHVRRGDTVEAIAGSSRGLRGRVLRTIPEKGKVVVEGVNMVWKHIRRSPEHPQGGRLQIEAPIDASNVMLVCPNRDCERHDRPVRSRTVVREDGTRARTCAKCGAEIPKAE
jgi:large subunit ribosomal protein L24